MENSRFVAPVSPQDHFAAELARRTDPNMKNLIVPSWVMKDDEFYNKVRARGFVTQRALDHFINREALRRQRSTVRFAGANRRRLFDPDLCAPASRRRRHS